MPTKSSGSIVVRASSSTREWGLRLPAGNPETERSREAQGMSDELSRLQGLPHRDEVVRVHPPVRRVKQFPGDLGYFSLASDDPTQWANRLADVFWRWTIRGRDETTQFSW
jgi:hypothetical protein